MFLTDLSATDIIPLITNNGFAIAMCIMVYTNSNKCIKELTNSVTQLCNKIDILLDRAKE